MHKISFSSSRIIRCFYEGLRAQHNILKIYNKSLYSLYTYYPWPKMQRYIINLKLCNSIESNSMKSYWFLFIKVIQHTGKDGFQLLGRDYLTYLLFCCRAHSLKKKKTKIIQLYIYYTILLNADIDANLWKK